MSNQTKVEAGMSTDYWPRALVYSVWTNGDFTKHTLNECKKGYSRNCDSKEDTMIRRETWTQFWIFLPSMPRTVFLILSLTARQTLCLAAAAWGPELWSASYGISVIKRLERGWERSPRVLRLTSSFISILCLHRSWWHQPAPRDNTGLSFFLQVRDCPQTSSSFTRVSKELRNKDEYSQVLFSGFCRKVQYAGKRTRRSENVWFVRGVSFFCCFLLALGCFSRSTRSPFHSLALRLSFVSARLSGFHVSSGERSPVRQEHKDAR